MAKGAPSFFLQHSIITGQYTSGNEFTLNGNDYVGLYHKLPNDEYWTEEKPANHAKLLAVKRFDQTPTVILYNKLNGILENHYISPVVTQPIITDNDYKIGHILRFFVQKRNNPYITIHEIDGEQLSSINQNNFKGINGVIWNHIMIKWMITGKNAASMNQATILKNTQFFPGLQHYLTNYLEFTK